MSAYDPSNVFAKILRKEIPCTPLYEDEYALAFADLHPRAKVHVLIIPKGAYVSSEDFHGTASDSEIVGYYRAVDRVLDVLGLKGGNGYRLLSNAGSHGGQEVPHFHTHLLAGQLLGPMVSIERA